MISMSWGTFVELQATW